MKSNKIMIMAIYAATIGNAFAWYISGTVQSSKGGVVSGVQVSVIDSASLNTTTNAQGYFEFYRQNPTPLTHSNPSQQLLNHRIDGNQLTVFLPQNGLIHINLVDPAGKSVWNKRIIAEFGVARAKLPEYLLNRALYLTIQDPMGQVQHLKKQVAADPIAPPLPLPRLRFQKTGFKDTTYQMLSDSVRNVQITLRDTTTPIATCPSPVLAAGNHNKTIKVNGVDRTYIVHVPNAYRGTSPVPLVVDFHPLGGSGSQQMGATQYKNVTDPEGVISVYPDGLQGPSRGAWNVGPCCVAGANDTSFARALVAEVKKTACIDSKKVYAVGFSMGGGMSHYSACHLADVFAAVAPAAFDLLQENQGACRPSRPIPVLSFRSTGDFVVSYNGGASSAVRDMPVTFLGAQNTLNKWAQLNQCTGSASAADANGCVFYSNCAGGVKVGLCTTQGGSHDQGKASIGWPWLKQFSLP